MRRRARARGNVCRNLRRRRLSKGNVVPGVKSVQVDLIRDALQHGEHRIVFGQNAADGFGGVHAQRLQFAKQEQAEGVVDVGVAEDGAGDRRLAYAFAGMEFRSGFDLRAQVGRGAEQKPVLVVGADGNLRLGASFTLKRSRAQGAAIWAGAVPLRKASSGGRA